MSPEPVKLQQAPRRNEVERPVVVVVPFFPFPFSFPSFSSSDKGDGRSAIRTINVAIPRCLLPYTEVPHPRPRRESDFEFGGWA